MISITARDMSGDLSAKVREISGSNPGSCIQCGTCSSVCPMDREEYIIPRRIMLATHLGLAETLRNDTYFEMCLSCASCAVRCPRGIDIPAVMDSLRQLILRENRDLIDVGGLDKQTVAEAPQMALVAAFRKLTA